uniref:Uncharacterized protein n=1 Tax=Aegilops tauschii subsp. strangulata TaxID=200361 RepID=A0A453T049_AEGTS
MQVDHVMMQGGDLSNILYMSGEPDVACFPRFENLRVGSGSADILDDGCATGGQITPNSILEDPMHHYGGSSYRSGGSSRNARGFDAAASVDVPIPVPRKKKSGGFFPQIVMSLNNRRKGAPHRSPFA